MNVKKEGRQHPLDRGGTVGSFFAWVNIKTQVFIVSILRGGGSKILVNTPNFGIPFTDYLFCSLGFVFTSFI